MKKLFLTLLVLVATVASMSAAISWVVVTSASGEVTEFALADQPKVAFTNGEVVITAGDQTLSLPTNEKVTFTFAEEVTGIDEALIQAVNPTFYWDNNTLQAAGLRAGEVVNLYNTNGMVLGSVRANNEGVATLSLEQHNGILIISTQSKSLKIRK